MGKWRAVGIVLSSLGILFGIGWVAAFRAPDSAAAPALSPSEEDFLLGLARRHLEAVLAGESESPVDQASLTPLLRRNGAAFVTLTLDGDLRGCMVDAFTPHEPLYENVLHNILLAASRDPRFPTVTSDEVPRLRIEISVLGRLRPLHYRNLQDLCDRLTLGEDGVVLTTTTGTSTFLPQVWATFPDPVEFLSQLCLKQGAPGDCWTRDPLPTVAIYRVTHFAEP